MKKFEVSYANEPHRNRAFLVRGICEFDVLNPCWDNRPKDIPGQHWGGCPACKPCTEAAMKAIASLDLQLPHC